MSSRKSRKSRSAPRTQRSAHRSNRKSRRSNGGAPRMNKASNSMTMTELQMMAKSHGIPFGGLHKSQLIRKINNYVY